MWRSVLLLALSLLPILSPTPFVASQPATTMEAMPPYAKWGRLAMESTKEKYPDTAIIDYLHIGAVDEGNTVTEKFKLWLRGKEKEFGVYIDITFHKETEEIIEITFEETDR